MKKWRSFLFMGGIVLLILAGAAAWTAVQGLMELRPAGDYEDAGTRTFYPRRVLPVQVSSSGYNGRGRRTERTRTAYMVYYRAADGSGYEWRDEVPTRMAGQDIVDDKVAVERRVLRIPADGTYITVEPDQTAESYTAGLRTWYVVCLGAGGSYLLIYGGAWCFLLLSRRRRGEAHPGRAPYPWEKQERP